MKVLFAIFLIFSSSHLFSKVQEISRIREILPEVSSDSIVLFDIDETLIETPIMLGGKGWRRYVKNLLKMTKSEEEVTEIHDKITYFIAKHVPYIAIEEDSCLCWNELQKTQIPVFCFTARGKHHWYDMPSSDGEELAVRHLKQAGFDLSLWSSHVDDALLLHSSYAQRVFFAYPIEDKGDLVLSLFAQAQSRPSKVVFIDDKMENVLSVDRAFEQLGIPAICFCYRHIDLHRSFDPMIANIQLEKLFFEDTILSDKEAMLLKEEYRGEHPDDFFLELISRLN